MGKKIVRTPATEQLTQLEFAGRDMAKAEALARHLGYSQTAYTSTSMLCGLFCLPENPANRPSHHSDARTQYPPYTAGCIIHTRELGIVFVQTAEDLRRKDLE
jgi:hypothetical protein